MKASEIFNQEDLAHIRFVLKLFNGKVIKIEEKKVDSQLTTGYTLTRDKEKQ